MNKRLKPILLYYSSTNFNCLVLILLLYYEKQNFTIIAIEYNISDFLKITI